MGYKLFCGIQHNRQLNNVVLFIQMEKWKTSGECTYKAASKSLIIVLRGITDEFETPKKQPHAEMVEQLIS